MRTRCAEPAETSAFRGELQAFGPWSFHLAANRRWRGITDAGSDGLFARSDRLAPSATNLASTICRLGNKILTRNEEKGTIVPEFVIRSVAWRLIPPPCRTTSKR